MMGYRYRTMMSGPSSTVPKNKNDKSQMWGVRHNTKVIGSFNVENSK
jgi:hypothetical protein